MSTVIKAENLGKKYIIGHQRQPRYQTLRDTMAHTARGIWQRIRHPLSPNRESIDLEELWALKDINFEVQQGERVGIIGRNGAGKSTLLKVLSRITEPTTGKVRIKGRVSSLLEVGTGFHPELTGGENIFLNGAILGMTRQEVKRKFDEIIAFAELEKFLDTPVKRYSSGMYVRLAFAVAAHLEPEILIVDEVLAVGDVAFQKKCLGKMGEVAKEGRTVLFVSHNMRAVLNLCDSAFLLEDGKLRKSGDVGETIQYYLMDKDQEHIYKPEDTEGDFVLSQVSLESETGEKKSQFLYSEEVVVQITFISRVRREWPRAGIVLRDSLGGIVFSTGLKDIREYEALNHLGMLTFRVVLPPCWLNIGRYSLDVSAHYPNIRTVFNHSSCLSFSIEEDEEVPGGYGYTREGVLRPRLYWEIMNDNCKR